MITKHLTPANARAIKKGERLACQQVAGLELIGRTSYASWRLYYRTHTGLQRRKVIGDYPSLGIDDAREAAREVLKAVATGRDPAAEWQELKEAPTVADLCARYMVEHARKKKAKSSADEDERQINSSILKSPLARQLVADVNFLDIEMFLDEVRRRKYARNDTFDRAWQGKEAPKAANRMRALLGKMFTLAETRFQMRPQGRHPVKGQDKNPESARQTHATPAEIGRLAEAMRAFQASRPYHVAALHVLLFTGARPGEAERWRWSDAKGSVEAGTLEFAMTDHKTAKDIGTKFVRVPEPAQAILAALPRHPGGLVFGGVDLRKTWEAVRDLAGCEHLQLRDLRRTFATAARTRGVPLGVVGKLFGHTNQQTTERYAYIFDATLATSSEETAAQIAEWMKEETA